MRGFHLSVERNSHLLWFCITALSDRLKKTRATFSANQKWNQNQSWVDRVHFPALRVSNRYLLRVLIGSLDCLCPLWLASVMTLVLVWRHSVENCSVPNDSQLSPCGHCAITDIRYYGQISDPHLDPSIEVLTENDSGYYGLSLFRTQNDVPKVSAITRVDCTRGK